MNRDAEYNRSEAGKARYARYRASEKGRRNERLVNGRHRVAERRGRIEAGRADLQAPSVPHETPLERLNQVIQPAFKADLRSKTT